MHHVCDRPHNDRSTRMCVCVRVCLRRRISMSRLPIRADICSQKGKNCKCFQATAAVLGPFSRNQQPLSRADVEKLKGFKLPLRLMW